MTVFFVVVVVLVFGQQNKTVAENLGLFFAHYLNYQSKEPYNDICGWLNNSPSKMSLS